MLMYRCPLDAVAMALAARCGLLLFIDLFYGILIIIALHQLHAGSSGGAGSQSWAYLLLSFLIYFFGAC